MRGLSKVPRLLRSGITSHLSKSHIPCQPLSFHVNNPPSCPWLSNIRGHHITNPNNALAFCLRKSLKKSPATFKNQVNPTSSHKIFLALHDLIELWPPPYPPAVSQARLLNYVQSTATPQALVDSTERCSR